MKLTSFEHDELRLAREYRRFCLAMSAIICGLAVFIGGELAFVLADRAGPVSSFVTAEAGK